MTACLTPDVRQAYNSFTNTTHIRRRAGKNLGFKEIFFRFRVRVRVRAGKNLGF